MSVSSHSGSLRYYFLNQSFVKNVPYRTYWFGRKVRVTSLDDFFETRNKPDFIKSDVEGLDIEVFRGAKELLKSTKYFQLEMCETQQSSYLKILTFFSYFLRIIRYGGVKVLPCLLQWRHSDGKWSLIQCGEVIQTYCAEFVKEPPHHNSESTKPI